MTELRMVPIESLGRDFITAPFLPAGQDEYYLRNTQAAKPEGGWRHLRADEIETLVKNGNTSDNWDNILVAGRFSANLIKNTQFYGLVRMGHLEEASLEYHDLSTPVGITNCRIIACDIGNNVAIHNVRYLSHFIIGDHVMLLNIDEVNTTNHAKFGNGILKEGEAEDVRVWLELINESGGRKVMPFDGMLAADAYMWAKFRDDPELIKRLGELTQKTFDSRRGFYGTIGDCCVIKNCRIIKDVKIGPFAYIKGANKLKNITINSSQEEPTQIGEGVEMVNGIVGRGCRVFYGCKAVRFIMGDNCALKYGARLIHSYLGDNSTVSCCEMLNNLLFPAHEQHHNNSFLTASLVMGQSNVAACATIGSNHNSRAPDGEIQAGRGFWPGLCVSVKHNCRFASFTLLTKGDYPAELDIPLPFSLVNNDVAHEQLKILPAFWWLYNMYALARNTWKYAARDKRKRKLQNVEFASLAPDTAEEIFRALDLLELWTAKAQRSKQGLSDDADEAALRKLGRELLTGPAEAMNGLEIIGEQIECSSRQAVILKAHAAYKGYRQMLHYYAVKNLLAYLADHPHTTLATLNEDLAGRRQTEWINLGGQLMTGEDFKRLKGDIKTGKFNTWPAVHEAYNRLWQKYPMDKQRHAYATLLTLLNAKTLTPELWAAALDEAQAIQQFVCDQTYSTRKKDFENHFRQITFANGQEMTAVLGSPESDGFIKQVRVETEEFGKQVAAAKKRV